MYNKIIIYLTSEDGTVLVKGGMEYTDIVEIRKQIRENESHIIGLLYDTIVDELKTKNKKDESELN